MSASILHIVVNMRWWCFIFLSESKALYCAICRRLYEGMGPRKDEKESQS